MNESSPSLLSLRIKEQEAYASQDFAAMSEALAAQAELAPSPEEKAGIAIAVDR